MGLAGYITGTVFALATNWAIYGAVVSGSYGLTVLANILGCVWLALLVAYAAD